MPEDLKKGDVLPDKTEVIKGLHTADWSPRNGRFSSNLFTGPGSSLSMIPENNPHLALAILEKHTHKPPERYLLGGGIITAGAIKSTALHYPAKSQDATVVYNPLPDYDTHCSIPQKLSKGLARQLIKELRLCCWQKADTTRCPQNLLNAPPC